MKKTIIMAAVSSLMCLPLSATIFEAGTTIFEKTRVYGKDTKIGFELINKSASPLWIAITNGGDITGKVARVGGGRMTRFEIDTKKETEMIVWLKNPGNIALERKWLVGGRVIFDPKPDKIYTFTKGKTIYLTWDMAKFPRPQTGPLRGILGKTDSGLSLANNVTKDGISLKFGKK